MASIPPYAPRIDTPYAELLSFVKASKDPTACLLVGCELETVVHTEVWGTKYGKPKEMKWTQHECVRCHREIRALRKFLPPNQHLRFADDDDDI